MSPRKVLFPTEPCGFGPSRFAIPQETPQFHSVGGRSAAKLRLLLRKAAPKQPGVYGMLDNRGRIIYIGKAKVLRTRLLSYFREDSRNPKAARIIRSTRRILWEQSPNEFLALLRELELIQHLRPRFNVLGMPGQHRHFYIC
ncbi:MAG: nucleotide excision repair endonuclease, partial [Gemmataceae bacterium]